jgi:LCP family protein required for cell wall assembly
MNFKTKKIRKRIPEKKKRKSLLQRLKKAKQKHLETAPHTHNDEAKPAPKSEHHNFIEVTDTNPHAHNDELVIPFGKKHRLKFGVAASVIILLMLMIGTVKAITSIDVGIILEAAGDKLATDAYGHTNFLILGTGGENHDGGDLTDTIMVASLDNEQKLVTMISIPRDTWVKDDIIYNSKINEVYQNAKKHFGSSTEGLEHLKSKVEVMMGVPIHYWVKADFNGFKELVDAIGGIDVTVEQAIYDPYYPLDGTYEYQTFSIAAGLQHLDGETALKYARSRKTTSDFDRANRQQQIIYAIKQQALASDVILSPERITEILNTLKRNLETNITVKEILTLGSFAADFSTDQINHRLIHDDPTRCGGFLYTPEREYYNGQFVLVPAGGFDFIHRYADLNFTHPAISPEETTIHLLNGTRTVGIAGETKQVLQRYCFDINRFGNATTRDVQETTYYYLQRTDENGDPVNSRPAALDFLQKMVPGKEVTEIPLEYQDYFLEADIILEFGFDYAQSPAYVEDPFYELYYLYGDDDDDTSPETTTTE